MAAHDDQRGSPLHRHGRSDTRFQDIEVVGRLAQVHNVPAVGGKALSSVVGKGEIGRAIDGDPVVVVEADEPVEALMTGKGGSLVADSLGEVAVAAQGEHPVVADFGAKPVAQPALGYRHAHRVGDSLAKGPGRDLDSRCVADLGVSRGLAAPLAEVPQVVEGEPLAGEVKHGVEENGRMAGAEHEPVPVRPSGVVSVVAQNASPKHMGQRRHGHRCALMPGSSSVGSIHGQATDDADALGFESSGKRSHRRIDPFRWSWEQHHRSGGCPGEIARRWSWEQHHRGGEAVEEIVAADRPELAGAEHSRHGGSFQRLVNHGSVVVGAVE